MEEMFLQTQFPQIEAKPIEALTAYARNPKQHGEEQLAKMVASLREFGWTFPILTDEQGEVIAGHGRLLAALRVQKYGWAIPGWKDTGTVPVLCKQGLSENQKRAYRILDNRIAEESGWDTELLSLELDALTDAEFDLALTGFDTDEISRLADALSDQSRNQQEIAKKSLTEPDESVKAMIDQAWSGIVREWSVHIAKARSGGLLSPKITPGVAAWHFIQAKHLGGEYPGYLSLAFCPERFWTAGDRKDSVPDCIAKAHEHDPSMRGVRWAVDERPDFDRVLSFGMPMAGARMPLDFPARLARDLIDEFTPEGGRVLDPCHGWGGRYVGFLLGVNAREYVGCDPSPVAHAGLERARSALSGFAESDKTAQFIEQPFEEVNLSGEFDFALTSPPYFDVEVYAGEDTSSMRYPKFDIWVQGFYLPMICKVAAHLKQGAVFALQVGSQTYPLAQIAIENAAACGFELVERRNAGMNNTIQQTPEDKAEAILILRKC